MIYYDIFDFWQEGRGCIIFELAGMTDDQYSGKG